MVLGAAEPADNSNMPPVPVVVFQDENGVDDEGALKEACRSLEKLEWDDNELGFFFNRAEKRMKMAGVKKQFTKFEGLSEILPKKVQDEVKQILRKGEEEFPNHDAYKILKKEVWRIFGPRPSAAVDRALGRVLSGKPSQLARSLVNDICKKDLDGCECCPDIVFALWRRHLPGNVRAGIAGTPFTKENFNEILELADSIFDNTQNPAIAAYQVAAVTSPSLDETLPALQQAAPEVAAMRGGRGGRGRGRGGRGNRGGRGGNTNSTPPAQNNQNGGQPQQRHKGNKHPDLPKGVWLGCAMHFKWGRQSYFCSEPQTCPWKNVTATRPASSSANNN